MILNIRGANGSGKTTVARSFINADSVETDLAAFQTHKGSPRAVIGYYQPVDDICVVGSYKTACGGMDAIPTFKLSHEAIAKAAQLAKHVICEGVLASTVFGSWAAFAREMDQQSYPFGFAYLQTPLEVCLQRIYTRNGGKKINERLVRDKIKAIAGTRQKALDAGLQVYDLPNDDPVTAAHAIIEGEGENYRGS